MARRWMPRSCSIEQVNPVELPESAFTLQEVATALASLGPLQKPEGE